MATNESLLFDGVQLNDGTTYTLEGFSDPPPAKKPEWVSGGDSDGAVLGRDPQFENRVLTLRVRVEPQSTMDLALAKIAAISDKIEEAERRENGLALVWTPATATVSFTWKVLSGEITDVPVTVDGDGAGWFVKAPVITVVLTCKPFGYGTEVGWVNLIANPSGETNATGWTDGFGGGALTSVTSAITGGSGTKAIRASGTLPVSGSSAFPGCTYAGIPVSPGSPISARAVFKPNTIPAAAIGMFALLRFDVGGDVSIMVGAVPAAGSSTEVSLTNATVPAGASTCSLLVALNVGPIAGAGQAYSLDLDAAIVTLSDGLPPGNYADGTTSGWVWSGTAHASTSMGPNVTSSSTPFATLALASVPGDVSAEARLIVTDTATQSRRYLEWGLEQRYYNAATSLLVDSDNMVTSGYAGTQTTRTGAYDPNASGNSAITANFVLANQVMGICGTGALSHVGTFRVKARVQADPSVQIRLAWKVGAGPLRANDWATTQRAATWYEIDLGLITIAAAASGTQAWTGDIQGQISGASVAQSVWVDYLVLVPAGEGYGKAVAPAASSAVSAVVGYDQFTSTTVGNALNARVAPLGGTWATSGSATDLSFFDWADGGETIGRSTTSDASKRFAILGSTNYTDSQLRIAFRHTQRQAGVLSGVILRWTDANNYAFVEIDSTYPGTIYLGVVVAGVRTNLSWVTYSFNTDAWYNLQLTCFASGRMMAVLSTSSGDLLTSFETNSTVVATGGTLATGKPGLYDANTGTGACTRYYDEINLATPGAEPLVINSGRVTEIRSDSALMQDSGAVSYGNVPAYYGSRFLVPCAGDTARTSRVLVKAHRVNIDGGPSEFVTDALQVAVAYTPRYINVPR